MHLRFRGNDVPQSMLDTIAAITDHAKLHTGSVDLDRSNEMVHFRITRFPLLKQRKTLGHRHDLRRPTSAVVTIRNVTACDTEKHTLCEPLEDVTLLFGLNVTRGEISASSAEERQGHTCFVMIMRIRDLDIEIADQAAPEL